MYIYKTINTVNGKIYIGQSKFNPNDNPEYLGSGFLLKRAIECYGRDQFKKEIIEECSTREQLCERERYWIATLKSMDRVVGYNICEGGSFGDTWTNNPRKEELRKLFSSTRQGKDNSNFNHKWTEEQKRVASERAKRCKYNIDAKTGENIAKRSDVRKKISDSKKGGNNPRACLWRLISPLDEVYLFEGGVSHELKKYGLTYSQFDSREPLLDGTMVNGRGWRLERIKRDESDSGKV